MTIYLMVKTHRKTGLKYLCKTIQNPFTYNGSGTDWKEHLKKHGKDISTEILKECEHKEELNYWGRYYSELWNIVSGQDDYGNKIWANRIPETGGGPGVPTQRNSEYQKLVWSKPGHREKMKESHAAIYSDLKFQKKQSKINTESQNRPEVKQKHVENTKRLWQNSDYRAARIAELHERWANPDFVTHMKAVQFIAQNKSGTVEKKSLAMKAIQTPEQRKKNSDAQLRPEVVAKKSTASKRQWEDQSYRKRMAEVLKSGNNNPRYDDTRYTFAHKDGTTETCTRYELQHKYKLSQSHLSMLISGNVKTCKGWTALDIK